jgi:cell division protein FtsW (lipid II flippase)
MVASGTRQAAIGVLLAMGLVLMFQARARVGRTLVAAGLLAAIAIPLVWSLAPRFEPYGVERLSGLPAALQSWRTDSRVTSLELEAKAIQRLPFTGSGLGITSVNAEAGFGTHNVLSSIAVELGLIPACVTVALLVVLLQCAWRVIRFGDVSTADRPVVLGVVGLFVIAFVGDMASGRMEGGFSFFAWGMPVYFLGRSFLQQNRGRNVAAYQGDMDRAGTGAR